MTHVEYSRTEDALILAHRKIGATFEDIGQTLTRTAQGVRRRWYYLVGSPAADGPTAARGPAILGEVQKPVDDEHYVARVIAQGGFTRENFWRRAALEKQRASDTHAVEPLHSR